MFDGIHEGDTNIAPRPAAEGLQVAGLVEKERGGLGDDCRRNSKRMWHKGKGNKVTFKPLSLLPRRVVPHSLVHTGIPHHPHPRALTPAGLPARRYC